VSARDTVIIGDVHGCSRELKKLVKRAGDVNVVLVGDLFTKGPDPVGVWKWIRRHRPRVVLGNHDDRLLQVVDGERKKDSHARAVIRALDAEDADWLPWVRSLPLWLRVGRYTVTHAALHPSGDPERTDRYTHLLRRRWPDDRDSDPFWWQVYEGAPVVFGHDAARGLIQRERDGRPWIVGLDTGCVYGGKLSGFLVEAEEIVQVKAKRAYKGIG